MATNLIQIPREIKIEAAVNLTIQSRLNGSTSLDLRVKSKPVIEKKMNMESINKNLDCVRNEFSRI